MLRTLLKTYWMSMFHSLFSRGSKKRAGRLKKIGICFLLLYLAGIFLFLFGAMFFGMAEPLHGLGLDWMYFLLMLVMAFLLMMAGSVFLAMTQLYEARDNELLLSLPIPASMILFSRMLMLYLTNLIYGAVVVLPALAGYGYQVGLSPLQLFSSLLLFFLIPLLAISISCLLGAAFTAVGSRIRHKSAAVLLLWIAFFAGYLYLYSRMFTGLSYLLTHAAEIAGLLSRILYPLYQMGMAVGEGNLLFLAYSVLYCSVPFAAAYLILSATFVKIITSNRGFKKIRYREKRRRRYPVVAGLMGKEWQHFTSSPGYMINAGIGAVFLVAAGVFLLVKQDMLSQIAGITIGGVSLKEEMNSVYLAALCFLGVLSYISAPSISLEGKSLWILKSCPVTSRQILAGKLLFHLAVCIPPLLFAQGAVFWVQRPAPAMAAVMTVLPVLMVILCGQMGLMWNLLFPRLDFLSETQVVKNSLSSTLTLLLSMLFSILPILLRLGTGLGLGIAQEAYFAFWTAAAAAGCVGLQIWLNGRGARRFEEL